MENLSDQACWFKAKLRSSLTLKLVLIGLIIFVLLIPLLMTSTVREKRASLADSVESEISSKWGKSQSITAPLLVFNLEKSVTDKNGAVNTLRDTFTVLPEDLKITGEMIPEIRFRGIYQARLYSSKLNFNGRFVIPSFPDGWVVKKIAALDLSISDIKGITDISVIFGGEKLRPIPGSKYENGVHCDINGTKFAPGSEIAFDVRIDLNGCRNLFFQPVGRNTTLGLSSSWPHPSFTGGFLPGKREVNENGFNAVWQINEMNRSYPQSWQGGKNRFKLDSALGVELVMPGNPYQQVERVSDYAVLLIAIVLVAFLVGETVTKVWVHPLQYFFVGLSLVMFYMLLLALCEHVSFGLSYVITAAVIVGMTTAYGAMIFAQKRKAAPVLGVVMALAYLLIYILIGLEDYALLVGSVILLALLALLMKFTGRINSSEKAKVEREE